MEETLTHLTRMYQNNIPQPNINKQTLNPISSQPKMRFKHIEINLK